MTTAEIIKLSFITGIAAGIIGSIYRYVLAYEKILSWWFRIGNNYERNWFFRPIWGCAKCFSGQLAFWFWVIAIIIPYIPEYCSQISSFREFIEVYLTHSMTLILGLLNAISTAILISIITGSYLESKR